MKLSRPVQGVIFDLDGVLLDTEYFYTEVTQEVCGAFGKVFDWSIKRNMIGRPSLESAQYLVDALSLPITPEEYLQRRSVRLEELFAASLEQPGAEAFTRALAARRVPIAVATSSEKRLFDLKTTRHRDWFATFSAIVVGDDVRVKAGKPAPDIFLVAAAELGLEPSRCVVFEDAPAGLEAAHAAGMQVIALPDPGMDRAPYAGADLVIDSFRDITPADLGL
ncbi:MAG TPA: HAD-IA family hydrolase [Candidatus Binatia bacterium]|nr:HAD-IA family hydrolase [Candidatus Binatia bacterium]